MVIRVPISAIRDHSTDPWMTLGEAVRWAAWLGQPEPQFGYREFADGNWISLGDMEESDALIYRDGAEKVRVALAAGQLEAWAQTGYEEPVLLPKARWSAQMLGSIVSWTEFYHPFDRIIVERERVKLLWPIGGIAATSPEAILPEKSPLALWLALELRRAQAAFDKTRKDQDADFEAKGMLKTGVRVKLTLKSASEICVALADATIAKAGEFQSTPGQLSEAEMAVLAFTREIANSAIPQAFFVSGETGLGGSAVKAATDRGAQLCRDIEGAFALAKANPSGSGEQPSPVASIFAIWRDEAINEFEVERDSVNSTFCSANRTQSAYHIRGLAEGAEKVIKALIDKARSLPLPDGEWGNLERYAFSVLSKLTEQIREIAVGANGRAPQPENAAKTDGLMQPVRKNIAREFEKLRLAKEFSAKSQLAGKAEQAPAQKVGTQPAKPKGGRPPEHDWRFMRELADNAIASRPAITRSALADSLVSDYGDKKPGNPPAKRTIERKLESWNLPAS